VDGRPGGGGARGSVRKAVITAAGMGTRFLPASKAQPKEMFPLVDVPAIQYVVEEAVAAGARDLLIITSRGKRTLEDHFDRSVELEHHLESQGKHDLLAEVRAIGEMADMHYVRQKEARGLGHAVYHARGHVGDEPFALLLGDDIMRPDSPLLRDMLAAHSARGASVLALKEVGKEEVALYGCAEVDAVDGALVQVRGVVEKPDPSVAPSNLAVIGRYVLTPGIFECLERTEPGRGGEIQLTDAIGLLIKEEPVYGVVFSKGRYDAGDKLGFLKANIELALERTDLGPPLLAFLRELVGGAE
jgi:UTP--glucose-1-phosphate uridylyltransferase